LQIVAKGAKSLQIVANRCKSLQIVAKILQCPINNLLIPYYIFLRDTVTSKVFAGQGETTNAFYAKSSKSSKSCAESAKSCEKFKKLRGICGKLHNVPLLHEIYEVARNLHESSTASQKSNESRKSPTKVAKVQRKSHAICEKLHPEICKKSHESARNLRKVQRKFPNLRISQSQPILRLSTMRHHDAERPADSHNTSTMRHSCGI
jgi:hypothetical protein